MQGAEDAAQCIHHLREALKQSANVYAITSAGVGEGRTSVTMSLALSICATGARTLVIDADLFSQGLTQRLKLDRVPGFFQALSGGNLQDYVQVSRSGVYIMPAGQARRADALSIRETALADLLKRIRERFDVILIDAGSMSCAETSLIARQAEGIVWVVGRGQEQSAVRSALTELEQLKVKVLGTVYNRAQTKDFYRSIHRTPLRRASAGPREVSETLINCGPLVRAVALSLRKDVSIMSASELAADLIKQLESATATASNTPTPQSHAA